MKEWIKTTLAWLIIGSGAIACSLYQKSENDAEIARQIKMQSRIAYPAGHLDNNGFPDLVEVDSFGRKYPLLQQTNGVYLSLYKAELNIFEKERNKWKKDITSKVDAFKIE